MAAILKLKYKKHLITAAQVWSYVDSGVISYDEAWLICGPRP